VARTRMEAAKMVVAAKDRVRAAALWGMAMLAVTLETEAVGAMEGAEDAAAKAVLAATAEGRVVEMGRMVAGAEEVATVAAERGVGCVAPGLAEVAAGKEAAGLAGAVMVEEGRTAVGGVATVRWVAKVAALVARVEEAGEAVAALVEEVAAIGAGAARVAVVMVVAVAAAMVAAMWALVEILERAARQVVAEAFGACQLGWQGGRREAAVMAGAASVAVQEVAMAVEATAAAKEEEMVAAARVVVATAVVARVVVERVVVERASD